MAESIAGEEVLIVETDLLIKNKSSSETSGPTGGYVDVFFDTDTQCLTYRNNIMGTKAIMNVTGPTGVTGLIGPTGPEPTPSLANSCIFSMVFRKNDSTEYIRSRVAHDIAVRFIYEGTDIHIPIKFSFIASAKTNNTEATFDITDYTGRITYCSITLNLTKTPTMYNTTSISNLPTNQSLLLFRFGPTTTKSYVYLYFATLK